MKLHSSTVPRNSQDPAGRTESSEAKTSKKKISSKRGIHQIPETGREICLTRGVDRGLVTWITRFFLKSALVCARQLAEPMAARSSSPLACWGDETLLPAATLGVGAGV